MEFRTMSRKELAAELNISQRTLKRKMKKHLKESFLKKIGTELLLKDHVEHIYTELTKVR